MKYIIPLAIILFLCVLSILYFYRRNKILKAGKSVNRNDEQYWILGMIYFNRDDWGLFVEGRGMGKYSINYAHPVSWLFIIALIGGIIIMTFASGG